MPRASARSRMRTGCRWWGGCQLLQPVWVHSDLQDWRPGVRAASRHPLSVPGADLDAERGGALQELQAADVSGAFDGIFSLTKYGGRSWN
jgi:hypothetical protein